MDKLHHEVMKGELGSSIQLPILLKDKYLLSLRISSPRGGGVLRFLSDGGMPLMPSNQYLSLRVILAEKVPIIKGFLVKKILFSMYFSDEMGENIFYLQQNFLFFSDEIFENI